MRGRFPVSNAGLSRALAFLKQATGQLELGEAAAKRCAVIVDELCGNMIRHDACLSADDLFDLEVTGTPGGARLHLVDRGLPFDPTTHRHEEQPKIGGHGLNVVRSMSVTFSYDRADGENRVTVLVERD